MKRKDTFYLLLFLFTFSGLFSQVKFNVGANFGGQISSLKGVENETETDFSLVPMFGVNLELCISPSVSIITGINFERWKKKREINLDPSVLPEPIFSFTEGYDFYNVPFLIRYKFGGNKDFFIDGGAFMNYFNKGRPNDRFGSLFIQFEDYNLGAVLGVGKNFDLTERIDLAIQLRNELGFTDVNKYEWEVTGDVKTNTTRLIATVSYQL
ncbi:hypothetical protein EYD45_09905 [Hyunsoonleella flava]|uniref:Outer membrane protein beta-barrel domain-containing protein n=1 Tax=Hyunsoonleella flava TaxID=2527939 RepID=A0A4Q9FE77_9FLAO|nr:outer membrane beta-barrel protein [Hyunsoonleella flava]TBN03313.1 hypothetical protein EYD45_09905 [Hyunsoonleella flava]